MWAMDWFATSWPVLLAILGLLMVFLGLVRRLVKLAFLGVIVGVVALVFWPLVSS
jgi:hypothetical protein